MRLPPELIHGMRGEGHEIRGDAEEEELMTEIECQDLLEAGKILRNGRDQSRFGVRVQPKGMTTFTANRTIDAGIPDSHCS
jgi:hypothetical protein